MSDMVLVPRHRFSHRKNTDRRVSYAWEIVDALSGVIDRCHGEEHAKEIAEQKQKHWEMKIVHAPVAQ